MKGVFAEILDKKLGSFYNNQAEVERIIEEMMKKATRNITIHSPKFGHFYSYSVGEILYNKVLNNRNVTILTNEKVEGDKKGSIDKLAEEGIVFFGGILSGLARDRYLLNNLSENLNFYFTINPFETDSELVIVDQSIALTNDRNGSFRGYIKENCKYLDKKYLRAVNEVISGEMAYKIDTIKLLKKAKEAREKSAILV